MRISAKKVKIIDMLKSPRPVELGRLSGAEILRLLTADRLYFVTVRSFFISCRVCCTSSGVRVTLVSGMRTDKQLAGFVPATTNRFGVE